MLFVIGLSSIAGAQACAFFVLARRAEAEKFLADRQVILLAKEHYPGTPQEQAQQTNDAAKFDQLSDRKMARSDQWRKAAIAWFSLASVFFVVGCYFGARAILKG